MFVNVDFLEVFRLTVYSYSSDPIDPERPNYNLVGQAALFAACRVTIQSSYVFDIDRLIVERVRDLSAAQENTLKVVVTVVCNERSTSDSSAPFTWAQHEVGWILSFSYKTTFHHRIVAMHCLVLKEHHICASHGYDPVQLRLRH